MGGGESGVMCWEFSGVEAGLCYTGPDLSVAVTALLVSVYGLSVCVPGLSF